ncbi:alpha/beta hydrolase [Thermomonospora umbrina]|uniref:Alpha/beta hydrolase family protein n=1 Tax=Thermomonospora umbrina TaxID=111806 RepID=A0A3D9T5W3_9ACTN|nr:alpha/beta hydrolase [Thermomonospora umbrina]REE99161.1 alpha/beta hydrolase family protein [Thermomonospora umbrina]
MKRLVLVTAAVSLGAGPLSAAPANAAPATASAVKWGKCAVSGPDDPMTKAQCAQVPVPLDHRRPNGRKISIAISRVKATDRRNYQGVLLINPGGPGGSGLAFSAGMARWLTAVGHPETAARYDIIGFDPRGVGSSKPALTCDPSHFNPVRPDYRPADAAQERAWLAKSKRYADACARKFGWLLPHMRTTDSARDMDVIRRALGRPKISFYGFSYGTYLGATYGTLFPKRVKRMVLDGNVNAKEVWYRSQLSQNAAFERNIRLWWRWIAKWNARYELGTTQAAVEKRYYQVRAQAKQQPIGGKIGPSELDDIVLNAGYNTGWYPLLATALSDWAVGKDAGLLLQLVNPGGEDNDFAVYNAVQAVDARWPAKWSTWHNDAVRTYPRARFNTWSNVWFNAPIHFWKVKGGPAFRLNGRGMPGVLLVQSSLDAATPYQGGVEMHRLLPSSRLLVEVGGKTHSNTLNGNACLDDRVAAYLNAGGLPASKKGPDAYCKAVPALNDPDPTAARGAGRVTGKDLPVGLR